MKIAIVGGRDFTDFRLVENRFDYYTKNITVSAIVSGGAVGVDSLAKVLADKKKLKIIEYLPNYEKYGRGAPLVRNSTIIGESDFVIAFWDGKSRGTSDSINN